MIKTTVKKWGNSLAIRIPQNIVNKFNLYDGNEIVFNTTEDGLVLNLVKDEKITHKDWKDFLVPTKNKRENVSENIDKILYGI